MAFVSLGKGLQAQMSQVSGEDYLFVTGLESRIPLEGLLALTMFALTSSPLKEGDSRLEFLERLRHPQIIADGEGGRLSFPDLEKV